MRINQANPRRWIELGGGVEMHFRPADGADEMLAEARAKARIREIADGARQASEYALESLDFDDLVSEQDTKVFTGVGYIIFATELAMIVGDDLKGVDDDQTGKPAAWTRRNVSLLMRARVPVAGDVRVASGRAPIFADRFFSLAMAAIKLERQEGNG